MMKTKFLTLFFLACVCLCGACTGVDFVIPEPVRKEEGKNEKPDEPDEPTPEPKPDQPTPDPEPTPDPDPTPEPEPTPDPDVPTFSNRVKWVASKADLEGLTIVAGDTIVWRKGTYADVQFSLNTKGTSSKPVVLTGEQGGEVVFTGKSSVSVTGEWIVVENLWWKDPSKTPITVEKGSSNVVVSECAITGYNTSESTKDYKWVSIYGSGNTVRNCYFADKRNMGTLLVVWMEDNLISNHTIENNYFSRPHSIDDGANGQETIRIGTSDYSLEPANCTVRGNYFYKCSGETEIVSNKSCGNLYEANLFRASEGVLTLRHGNDCTVRGNYFLGDNASNTGGVRIIGERHLVENNYMENLRGSGYKTALCLVRGEKDAELSGYAQVRGAVVRNNTIVGCRYSMHVNYAGRDEQTEPVVESTITNNTIVCKSSSDYAVYLYSSPAPSITWSGNKIYGGKQQGISLATLSAAPSIASVAQATAAIENGCGPKWKQVIK